MFISFLTFLVTATRMLITMDINIECAKDTSDKKYILIDNLHAYQFSLSLLCPNVFFFLYFRCFIVSMFIYPEKLECILQNSTKLKSITPQSGQMKIEHLATM